MPNATTREPISIEEFEAKAKGFVQEVIRSREPVTIAVDGKPAAVLLDLDTYHEYIHRINLAWSLLEAEADIRAGKVRPLDDVINEMLNREDTRSSVSATHRKRSAANSRVHCEGQAKSG